MSSFLKKVWAFIIKSSANPKATSATVLFALVGIIPYIMQAIGLACQFGSQCYDLDPNILELIATSIADGVYYSLYLVSILGTLWGLCRKLYRTFAGTNLVLNSDVQ